MDALMELRGRKFLLAVLAGAMLLSLGVSGVALGHAHLREGDPGAGSTVTEPISEVHIRFSEAVEVGFSTFKVYRLPALDEGETVDEAARALMEAVLQKRDDDEERADAGLAEGQARTSETVVLLLKDDLEPGTYVVMWRVLSIDTHVTQEYYTFTYAPEEE